MKQPFKLRFSFLEMLIDSQKLWVYNNFENKQKGEKI